MPALTPVRHIVGWADVSASSWRQGGSEGVWVHRWREMAHGVQGGPRAGHRWCTTLDAPLRPSAQPLGAAPAAKPTTDIQRKHPAIAGRMGGVQARDQGGACGASTPKVCCARVRTACGDGIPGLGIHRDAARCGGIRMRPQACMEGIRPTRPRKHRKSPHPDLIKVPAPTPSLTLLQGGRLHARGASPRWLRSKCLWRSVRPLLLHGEDHRAPPSQLTYFGILVFWYFGIFGIFGIWVKIAGGGAGRKFSDPMPYFF
jgi:hypothetical protein